MSKILVTGKNGQLGKSIQKLITNTEQNDDFIFVGREELDLCNESMIDRYFKDNSFDVICSAGSLSYGDNSIVMNEIYRVLVKGGIFIAIDSLNNNPIYKLNRYIHFLLGNRSKSTLQRMPTIKLLEKYTVKFDNVEVAYFGSLTWLFPILRKFLNDDLMKEISSSFDKKINIKKSAFKFTIKAIK